VFEKIFKTHGPFEIVANFAAHKHVRSEKDIFSIEAMIENNVLKARKLLDLLIENPPEHFFCVSTDKAANPVNIMGASKKLMEELIMAYSDRLPIKTARFANVAFSNGSLPLGFLERLNKHQPWACPLGIRRFFVSPQESGELCLIASIMGESGDIFYPKLDEEKDMIPFDAIAKDLINFLGMKPDICESEDEARRKALTLPENPTHYPIYFFGSDTSGEKAYEEFFTDKEVLDENSFINLGVVKNSSKRSISEIDDIFQRLKSLFDSDEVNKAAIVNILKTDLPNFEHIETGKGLDSKM
jgi:FlaA1/EpsC-like NDP-sugar epimerase